MDTRELKGRDAAIAGMTIALGALGLFRLIPEILGVLFYLGEKALSPRYVAILCVDTVLGLGALAAGGGLRRNSRWAAGAAVVCWAAAVAKSAVILPVAVSDVISRPWRRDTALMIARISFYGFCLLPSPFVLYRLFAGTAPRRSSWKSLTVLFLSSATLTALAVAYLLDLYPFRPPSFER